VEKTLKISDIKVGERQRKDMGDLKSLAASIKELGLLQAVVCTPDNKLVCGERRVRAVRDILKGKTIDARVMDVDIMKAENAENEYRKSLLTSEKVAWAKTIEESGRYAGRQGSNQHEKKGGGGQNGPLLAKSGKSQCLVAADVGFSSKQQLERASRVVEKGCAELVEAMDKGTINVSRADTIVRKHPDVQKQKEVVKKLLAGTAKQRDLDFTAAETFIARMDDIIARVDGIDEQFGGVAGMFDSELWASSTKPQRRNVVARISTAYERMQKLNRAAQAYGKANGLI
jgi:hypothetical protein